MKPQDTPTSVNDGSGGALRNAFQRVLGRAAPVSDAELLTRYLDESDAAAFEEIIARHGSMVMGVARRRVPRSSDAEDVFQATFWLLARDAYKIRERDRLTGWLYQVAFRMAKRCRRRSAAEVTEAVADPHATDPSAAAGWREVAEAVDTELLRLPDDLRTPLVLCLLEGATQDQAAARLGWSYSTLRRRFDLGRALLRQRLERRGLSPLCVAAVVIPSAVALGSVSPELSRVVASFAGGTSVQAVSSTVRSLLSPTVIGMKKTALALVCLLGLGLAMLATSSARPPGTQQTEQPKKVAQEQKATEKQPPLPKDKAEMRFRVLGEDGKPLAGAKLSFGVWAGPKDEIPDRTTDSDGVAVVIRPAELQILRVWCYAKGHSALFRGWASGTTDPNNPLPAEFTFPMQKATSIGGRIVDARGNGIAGAKVEVECRDVSSKDLVNDISYHSRLSGGVRTDKDGRWTLDNVPAPAKDVTLSVSHPDFISDLAWFGDKLQKQQGVTMAQLRKKEAVIRMEPGARISGVVTDAEGKPLPKAVVVFDENPYDNSGTEVQTDKQGRYVLPTLKPGAQLLTVVAVGHAPAMRELTAAVGAREENFRLEAGHVLKVRVIDQSGQPVKTNFRIETWRGKKSIYTHRHSAVIDMQIPNRSDANGYYEWTWAPADGVKFVLSSESSRFLELELVAKPEVQTITLQATPELAGRVTDAKTGRPVPKFRVYRILEFSADFLSTDFRNRAPHFENPDGVYRVFLEREDTDYRVLIEAEGYRGAVSKPSLIKNKIRQHDFALEPAAPVSGRVLDRSGKPVPGITVSLANSFQSFRLSNSFDEQQTATDAEGRFQFPAQPEAFTVVATGSAGIARRDCRAEDAGIGDLTLEPWASLSGILYQDGKPVPDQDIFMAPITDQVPDRRVYFETSAKTDATGAFTFDRVPPGPVRVSAYLGPWEDSVLTSSDKRPVVAAPGEKLHVDLGAKGAKITGDIRLTGELPEGLDLKYSLNYLVRRVPEFATPKGLKIETLDATKPPQVAALDRNAYPSHRRYFVKPTPAGPFQIHGVPAGEYWLTLQVFEKPKGCLVDPVAVKVVPVTVTAEQAAGGELALPEIRVPVRPPLKVGEPLPELSLRDISGKELKLADFKGRHVLLHGWAGWCSACPKDYPALRKLVAEMPKEKIAVVGLNLDQEPTTARDLAAKYEFPWPQARLGANVDANPADKWRIGSIPLYLILAPDGTLALRTDSLEVAAEYLKEKASKK